MTCPHCGHAEPTVLIQANGHRRPLVTSDAQLLDGVLATRTLCPACACIGISYDPADRLEKFFAQQYDVSDTVQNNLVVHAGHVTGKHTVVKSLVGDMLKRMGEHGRCLEIACGSGELSRWFSERRPGWRYWGVDPAADAGQEMPEGSVFLHDRFRTDTLVDAPFDAIIAHGFLNRAPTLPELRKIRFISRPGTLLSVELVTLEQSVFAPHVWDHPFHFRRDVFEAYLEAAGFEVVRWQDCVSAWNCLARCNGKSLQKPDITELDLARTRVTYGAHLQWWRAVARRARDLQIPAGQHLALFGAGLYSTVFTQVAVPHLMPSVVIDDIRAGTSFAGRPVISLQQAAARGDLHVLLCVRDRYEEAVASQLRAAGIPFTSLAHSTQELEYAHT